MALSNGRHHFKCPWCRNQEEFTKESENIGIYIQEKDANWELEENEGFYNFVEMANLYSKCDVSPCQCTKGPLYDLKGTGLVYLLLQRNS